MELPRGIGGTRYGPTSSGGARGPVFSPPPIGWAGSGTFRLPWRAGGSRQRGRAGPVLASIVWLSSGPALRPPRGRGLRPLRPRVKGGPRPGLEPVTPKEGGGRSRRPAALVTPSSSQGGGPSSRATLLTEKPGKKANKQKRPR